MTPFKIDTFDFTYRQGYEDGYREARAKAERENALLRAQLDSLYESLRNLTSLLPTPTIIIPTRDLVRDD